MENSINIKRRIQLPAKTKQILFDCIAYAFLILFLFTAIEKFMDNAAFVKSLKQYTFLEGYEIWISWLVPGSELAVSILLFFPKTRKLGIFAALALMIILTIGLLFIIKTTGLSSCGCSGYLAQLSESQHIWFNGIFIALGIIGVYLSSTSFRPKRRDLFAIVATLSIIAIPFIVNTIYNKNINDIEIIFDYDMTNEEYLDCAKNHEKVVGFCIEPNLHEEFKSKVNDIDPFICKPSEEGILTMIIP